MTILAQQGYGKSDKIQRGIADESLSGVILSPRDMTPDAMQGFIDELRTEFGDDIEVLLDPQFFGTVIQDATDRNLPDYPYYQSGLRRSDFLSARSVSQFVSDTLEYQAGLHLSALMSPTIAFDSFSEPASQTALQLGAEASALRRDYDARIPMLTSFVIGEAALADSDGVDEFLDIVSTWEADGFYIIVEPKGQAYPSSLQSERLASFMYLVHALATINEFRVYLGYSDFYGLLLSAVGGTAQATGWYGGLRQFSRSRWQPSSGGKAARARYSSEPLMNSILQIPELSTAYEVGLLDLCLSESDYDEAFTNGNPAGVEWAPATQCLQHWDVLSSLSDYVTDGADVGENLSRTVDLIEQAHEHYAELTSAGVSFDRLSGPGHLGVWFEAINIFANRAL